MILLLETSELRKRGRRSAERSRTMVMAFAVLLITLAAILAFIVLGA